MNLENVSKEVMKEIKEKDIKGAASVVADAAKNISDKDKDKIMNTAKGAFEGLKDKVDSIKK